nr:hypothetical protein [Tanacetum cinerariifolium]
MEEYIKLEEEKARRHGRTFNWQTAKFRKVENYEDEDDCFIDFETEFPAIVFDNKAIQSKPTVCPPNENMIDFRISLDESDDEDYTTFTYGVSLDEYAVSTLSQNEFYFTKLINFSDMAPLPAADQRHPWLIYQIEEYSEGIRHSFEQRLKTNGADRLTRRRMKWRQFILALGLHTEQEMAEAGFGAY